MGSRARQFSIVFHNVKDDCKAAVERFFSDAQKRVIALEPYPEQHGFHIHVFVQYSNARRFKSVLSSCERFKSVIIAEKPPSETRDWGRVQVDVMRGSFDQAHKYLTAPSKDKPLDPDVRIRGRINSVWDMTLNEFREHIVQWTYPPHDFLRPHNYDDYLQNMNRIYQLINVNFGHEGEPWDDETFDRYLETTTVRDHINIHGPPQKPHD